MNKSKVLSIIAAIAVFICVIVLMDMGLDMGMVKTWRINGEHTKANIFLLTRGITVLSLAFVAIGAVAAQDMIEARQVEKQNSYNC